MEGKEPKKGEHGGECNRTACKNTNAQWYNKVTEAFYCTKCARMINESSNQSNQGDLCELKREDDTNINSELTNKEVLQKAIDIAMDNGYLQFTNKNEVVVMDETNDLIHKVKILIGSKPEIDYQLIIFSHDFAKAFWGDKPVFLSAQSLAHNKPDTVKWKHNLQQMVVEENRINYLRKFIS